MNPTMKIVLLSCIAVITLVPAEAYRRVCYYASWAGKRKGPGHFSPDMIDPHLCTHINYAFVGVDEDGNIMLHADWHEDQIHKLQELKKMNSSLKLLISCGGWKFGSETFSKLANSPDKRKGFANNSAEFVKKYGYDGFDIDWEYPGKRGGSTSDKEAFVELLKVFRERFDQEQLILTAATAAVSSVANTSYSLADLSEYLDFINIMTYNLHGTWEGVTGHTSPLYYGSYLDKINGHKDRNVETIVDFYIKNGANPQKLNIGVNFHAKTFTLKSENETDFGSPITGPGHAHTFYSSPGHIGFNEICVQQNQNYWTNRFDDEQGVPYSFHDDQWVGYENEKSLRLKVTNCLPERIKFVSRGILCPLEQTLIPLSRLSEQVHWFTKFVPTSTGGT